MFLVVALMIMVSVYMVQNKKISGGSKTGWFAVVAVFALFVVLSEVL